MKRKIRVICLILCIAMLTAGFIAPINAEEESEETSYGDGEGAPIIQLFIITDGDFITIGDNDIIGELELDINQLGKQVILLNNKVNDAQETANVAYLQSGSALATALNNKDVLKDHNQTLILHYNSLNDTIDKLWILRDEVVAFEGHYMTFVDDTNSTLNEHEEGIGSNYQNTEYNKDEIELLQNNYDRLQNNLNFMILIFLLVGGGFLVFGAYVLSKRYYKNKRERVKTSKRQPTLADYAPSASVIKKAKKRKAHIRVRKIRVNKRKSPIRAAKYKRIIHKVERLDKKPVALKNASPKRSLHIRRNPERNPIRFMFSFFHKL